MLIVCQECQLPVSDKAKSCPHCGFPMQKGAKQCSRKKSRMRLPNGFGQISEIKGRSLRKPFRAMITVGKTSSGKPICRILKPEGYFETYNDAYQALIEYNKNPYDLDNVIVVRELYERWSTEYFKTLKSPSSARTIKSAWSYCSSIENISIKELKARHIKGVIENEGISANLKGRIKSLFNLMLDYAVEYELVDKNVSRTFNLSENIITERETAKVPHLSFTNEEMEILWKNVDVVPYVNIILLQCYTGWRPQELGLIKRSDVDFENMTIKGGMKTDAGTDRIVPIHSRILPLAKKIYEESEIRKSQYFISCIDGGQMTYEKYRLRFKKIIETLSLDERHRAHDPRKQFVTMAKKYNVDEYAIKRIIGHAISDITESVYTDRDDSWLKNEIEKIL